MFSYCKNNPINRKDEHGFMSSMAFEDAGGGADLVNDKGVVEQDYPSISNLIGAAWGTVMGTVENLTKDVVGYVGKDSIIKFFPSSDIVQKIKPYEGLAKGAAKWATAIAAGLDIASTWDPMVKMSLTQRVGKTTIQIAGAGVAIAAGAYLTGPLVATSMLYGGTTAVAGVLGAFAIDAGIGYATSFVQDSLYKKLRIE